MWKKNLLEKVILENYFRLRDYPPSEKNFPLKDTHTHTHTHTHTLTYTFTQTHTHTSGPNLKREEGVLKGGNWHRLPGWSNKVFFFELLRPKKVFKIL